MSPSRRSALVISRIHPVMGWWTTLQFLTCQTVEYWREVASELLGRLSQQYKESYRLTDTVAKLTFVFLCVTFRVSPFLRSSHVLTKGEDSADSARPIHHSTSDRRVARTPAFSPRSHSHLHTGQLVITIVTPILRLNPSRE